jgi:hypothetical protein
VRARDCLGSALELVSAARHLLETALAQSDYRIKKNAYTLALYKLALYSHCSSRYLAGRAVERGEVWMYGG